MVARVSYTNRTLQVYQKIRRISHTHIQHTEASAKIDNGDDDVSVDKASARVFRQDAQAPDRIEAR